MHVCVYIYIYIYIYTHICYHLIHKDFYENMPNPYDQGGCKENLAQAACPGIACPLEFSSNNILETVAINLTARCTLRQDPEDDRFAE